MAGDTLEVGAVEEAPVVDIPEDPQEANKCDSCE